MWRNRITQLPAARQLLSDAGFLKRGRKIVVRDHIEDTHPENDLDESVGSDEPTGSFVNVEDDVQLSSEDEHEMGSHNHNYTDADARAVAKWIAGHPEWSGMTKAQKFEGLAAKVGLSIIACHLFSITAACIR